MWGVHTHKVQLHIDPLSIVDDGGPIVFDEEDDEHGNIVGVGFSFMGHSDIYYVTEMKKLELYLRNAPLIAHMGRTDIFKLRKAGLNIRYDQLIYDTCLAAHLLNPTLSKYGLKDLVKDEGIEYPKYEEIVGKGPDKVTLDKLPLELVANYNAMDVYATKLLYQKYSQKVEVLYPCTLLAA